jgi:hypothetical protein
MTTTSIVSVPGLADQSAEFVRELARIADANGWNADGLAAVMSHESRFNPAAHTPIPGQTATGLIQFIESTAKRLGTTTAELIKMTAVQQLPYVEKFFKLTLGGRKPTLAEDYILATYGRPDATGKPDSFVLDRQSGGSDAESMRYRVNAALDREKKGAITAGDLRRSMSGVIASAHGKRVTVPAAPPPSSGTGAALLALIALLALVLWGNK